MIGTDADSLTYAVSTNLRNLNLVRQKS